MRSSQPKAKRYSLAIAPVATRSVASARARSSLQAKPEPIRIGLQSGRKRRQPGTTLTQKGTLGSSIISVRPTGINLLLLMGSGCGRLTCITVPFPRSGTCLNRSRTDRRSSTAATTCSIRRRLGSSTPVPEAERVGWCYDTSVVANSNAGHLWGTNLSSTEKDALVEYMKTQ